MKKIIIICIISLFTSNAFAQKLKNYFQFGIGTGYLMNADMQDTPFVQLEYGKTYKWVEFGVTLEYAKSSTYHNEYHSLVLKTKFDIIRMINKNSRHSLKLGIGSGIGSTDLYNWYKTSYNYLQEHNSRIYTLQSVSASYEYNIVDNVALGVFFNNYTEEIFFGLHFLGISARYDF